MNSLPLFSGSTVLGISSRGRRTAESMRLDIQCRQVIEFGVKFHELPIVARQFVRQAAGAFAILDNYPVISEGSGWSDQFNGLLGAERGGGPHGGGLQHAVEIVQTSGFEA